MKIRVNAAVKGMVVALLLSLTASCGDDAGFSGLGAKKSKSENVQPKVSPPPSQEEVFDLIDWQWSCDEAMMAKDDKESKKKSRTKHLNGKGVHTLDRHNLKEGALRFSGSLCQPRATKRDILFVVDISTSMEDNDAVRSIDQRCGRLDAVEHVVQNISAANSSARFGIMTFGASAGSQRYYPYTNRFSGSLTGMYADLGIAQGVDVLCRYTSNDTLYAPALTTAEEMFLNLGREDAVKEIYFISDGDPYDNSKSDYESIAERLKTRGVIYGSQKQPVTIATIMLGSNSLILKGIASKVKGEPLHRDVAKASDLLEVLEELSRNELEYGVLKIREIGTPMWTKFDLLEKINQYQFRIPDIELDPARFQNGIEVVLEYRDSRQHQYSYEGKILWDKE